MHGTYSPRVRQLNMKNLEAGSQQKQTVATVLAAARSKIYLLVSAGALVLFGQMGHAEVIGGLDFPQTLGGFALKSVIDNKKIDAGLGTTLFYSAPGVKIAVFVYDDSLKQLPDGIDSQAIRSQFAQATRDISQAHPDAEILAKNRAGWHGVALLHAAFQYAEEEPGARELVTSHLYLTSRSGNFVKIRATYSAVVRPVVGDSRHVRFMDALCVLLGR